MTDRRFLIVNGVENHRPRDHWQHWLAEELRRRHEVVLYPQLPDPDAPRLAAWLELIRAELDQLGTGERIVICHSLGALAWLHATTELRQEQHVDRVMLVSPPSPEILWPEIGQFAAPGDLSPEVVRSASGSARIVCSDDDPYCPAGAAEIYGAPLDIPVDCVAGGGHLSAADGYGPWPGVLAWCLDDRVPVT